MVEGHGRKDSHRTRRVIKELQNMIAEGQVDSQRLLTYVRQKAKSGRMGRPPVAEDIRLSVPVTFRVTRAELEKLKRAARHHGGVSKLMRSLVLKVIR